MTQTDNAPSWISAAAMAPCGDRGEEGDEHGLLLGWWNGSEWGNEKAPKGCAEGAFGRREY